MQILKFAFSLCPNTHNFVQLFSVWFRYGRQVRASTYYSGPRYGRRLSTSSLL